MLDLLFNEIALVIITAGVIGLIFVLLRQPLIIAYIATGLVIGPSILGLTQSEEVFHAMSEVGVAFLLFMVGLNLNWRNVKDVGAIAVIAGLGQVIFTSGIGFFLGGLLGFDTMTSLFIGVAFAFSSTIIIVKMLADKEDLDRFYGRISVGMLIVQDIIAMIVLLVIGTFSGVVDNLTTALGLVAIKGVFVLIGLWVFAKYILPPIFRFAAKSQELLFLLALSWCFAVASGLHFLGFGIEIGALLAGIALAGGQFHREIESNIKPLRDFFLVIFFIVLGTGVEFTSIGDLTIPIIVFSLFILIGNPVIIILLLRAFGYHPRTGWLVGGGMAQISEFSFIMIGAGVAAGLLMPEVLPLTVMTALITIAVSTYFIKYNEQLYRYVRWALAWLENGAEKNVKKRTKVPAILLFGYEHLGAAMLPTIKKLKKEFLIVDIDPAVIEDLESQNITAEYGDAGNEDFLNYVHAHKSKLVISTIPDMSVSLDLLDHLKHRRSKAPIILTAKTSNDAAMLYDAGATFVILPNMLGGELFSQLLKSKTVRKASWNVLAKKQKKILGA
jgi:Kef-type K+ transport system membrane component KefB